MKKKVILKNSFTGIIQVAVNSILIFVTIPLFFRILGSELFGIFATITLIGNLNLFTSLGINSSLLKYLSEQGKSLESNYDIKVAIIAVCSLLIPLSIFAVVFNRLVLFNLLNVPENYYSDVIFLYIFLICSNFILMLGQIFVSILDSQQKIYLSNAFQIIYNFLYWGSILCVILFGFGLNVIGGAILSVSLIWFSIVAFNSVKIWGDFKSPGLFKNFKRVFKKQMSLGGKVYVGGLLGFLQEPFSKILISHFLGIGFVGYYDVALKIRNQLWGLIGKLLHPLFPLIASLKDKEKIKHLVHDLSQKVFYISIPIVISLIFTARPIVSVWIGENIEIISNSIITINSVYLVFSVTALPMYIFLLSKGDATKTIVVQFFNVFINMAVFFITYKFFGYYSIILGNSLAIVFSFILLLYYQKKYLNSLIFDSINQIVKLSILVLICFGVGLCFDMLLSNPYLKIFITPIAIIVASVITYKHLLFFRKGDIDKYFGEGRMSNILNALLVKG